jgi:2-phospho-L-lactate guanylyltransferase
MRTVAILPMKSFSQAKQRLRVELSDADRRALVDAMFSDVLVALRRVPALERVIVVSGDRVAQRIGGGYGATVVEDDERGHNTAAKKGIQAALEDGIERALLVPGDCPLLDPKELERLLVHPAGERSALIVPDRHGTGTNALLLAPPDVLAPSFGPDSRRRHMADAEAAGVPAEVVEVPSLALDVDTPDDLEALQRRLAAIHGGAAHTRGMLNQLMRAGS